MIWRNHVHHPFPLAAALSVHIVLFIFVFPPKVHMILQDCKNGGLGSRIASLYRWFGRWQSIAIVIIILYALLTFDLAARVYIVVYECGAQCVCVSGLVTSK